MTGDVNFKVSTEGLAEKGKIIGDETKIIKDALADIDAARKSLDGWVSKNKERYDNKLASKLPKLDEMTDVLNSYSGVAIQTAERAIAVENKIAAAIDNDIPA